MAKREIVKVDEEAIKKMIAGDIPNWGAINATTEEEDIQGKGSLTDKQKNNSHEIAEDSNNENDDQKATKKRKSKFKYSDTFLIQQRYPETKQSTIILDKKVYDSIRKILKATDGITLANFINNVLIHHFNEYQIDIDDLKKEYISNLFNDK